MGSFQKVTTGVDSRHLVGLGTAILLLAALGGCSATTPDRSEAAVVTPSLATASGSPGAAAAPGEPDADAPSKSETVPSTSTATTDASVSESGDSSSAGQTPGPGAEADPEVSDMQPTMQQPPEPALSDDEIRETYGDDEPEPAEPVAGTLCNLSRSHFEALSAKVVSGEAIDDSMLRLAALSLSDDLGVWEGISWQFPDLGAELDTAREIYAHWEYAIGLVDVGDSDAALVELANADDLIEGLPGEDVAEVGC